MKSYKVALATRFTDKQLTNGDVVQMLKTKKYLEARHGLDVVVVRTPEEAADSDADIIHVFSMPRIDDTIGFVNAARRTNKKLAISTVYWDLTHASLVNVCYKRGLLPYAGFLQAFRGPAYRLYNAAQSLRGVESGSFYSKAYRETRQGVLRAAGMLLPNSDEELGLLARDFGFSLEELQSKSVVVPNAVDLEVLTRPAADPVPDLDNFVLCVASLDPAKNQLGLVKALYDIPDLWIVLRGSVRNPQYADELRKLAERRGKVRILGELADEEVACLYRKARVHVLASFRESTGLASLEALASGCEIVIADAPYCPIHWYQFDRYGHVCDPYSEKSIRQAVLSSFDQKRNTAGEEYRHAYSYERAVDLTKQAYDRLVKI
jgi:glycosyltransferase involved in cell wall biosynthesis